VQGKRVLVRADLNVPMDGDSISDDTRIRAAIPTLKYLVDNGAKVLLTSHLVRSRYFAATQLLIACRFPADVIARCCELHGSRSVCMRVVFDLLTAIRAFPVFMKS
jgi:hypothetical protein